MLTCGFNSQQFLQFVEALKREKGDCVPALSELLRMPTLRHCIDSLSPSLPTSTPDNPFATPASQDKAFATLVSPISHPHTSNKPFATPVSPISHPHTSDKPFAIPMVPFFSKTRRLMINLLRPLACLQQWWMRRMHVCSTVFCPNANILAPVRIPNESLCQLHAPFVLVLKKETDKDIEALARALLRRMPVLGGVWCFGTDGNVYIRGPPSMCIIQETCSSREPTWPLVNEHATLWDTSHVMARNPMQIRISSCGTRLSFEVNHAVADASLLWRVLREADEESPIPRWPLAAHGARHVHVRDSIPCSSDAIASHRAVAYAWKRMVDYFELPDNQITSVRLIVNCGNNELGVRLQSVCVMKATSVHVRTSKDLDIEISRGIYSRSHPTESDVLRHTSNHESMPMFPSTAWQCALSARGDPDAYELHVNLVCDMKLDSPLKGCTLVPPQLLHPIPLTRVPVNPLSHMWMLRILNVAEDEFSGDLLIV